jgi:hypothetical protein
VCHFTGMQKRLQRSGFKHFSMMKFCGLQFAIQRRVDGKAM